jgi:hypothetical protein
MFVKMHHAIADGIATVATTGVFLDATPARPRNQDGHGHRHRCRRHVISWQTTCGHTPTN